MMMMMMMKGGMGRAEETLEEERFIDAECHESWEVREEPAKLGHNLLLLNIPIFICTHQHCSCMWYECQKEAESYACWT